MSGEEQEGVAAELASTAAAAVVASPAIAVSESRLLLHSTSPSSSPSSSPAPSSDTETRLLRFSGELHLDNTDGDLFSVVERESRS